MVEEREVLQKEIYWAELKSAYERSSIQTGLRPVLVVSNNLNNQYCSTVNVIPITSQHKKNLPVHVELDTSCGLPKSSIALVEQSTTIPKSCLKSKIGEISDELFDKITKAMQIQKGKAEPFDIYRVKRLIYAIIEANTIQDGKFIKSALISEFKSYCDSHGKDYKKIFKKYRDQAIEAVKPLARVQVV